MKRTVIAVAAAAGIGIAAAACSTSSPAQHTANKSHPPASTTTPPGDAAGASQNATANPAEIQSLCSKSSQTYTASDQHNNTATVTFCGYQIASQVNGKGAPAGDEYIISVYEVQADQAASFNTNDWVRTGSKAFGIGPVNATNNSQIVGTTGEGSDLIDASGDVRLTSHAAWPPTDQGSPSYVVSLAAIPQPEKAAQFQLYNWTTSSSNGSNWNPLTGPMSAGNSFSINWAG